VAQPALERALAGQRLAGEQPPQLDAHAPGPPAGVVGAELHGGLAQRALGRRLPLAAGAVVGPQAGGAAGAEAAE